MMKTLTVKLLCAAAMLMLLSSPSLGTVIATDDFESVSASTAAAPDSSGDFDPTTTIWTQSAESAISDVQVTSYGTPGPAGGSQYLRVTRVTGSPQFWTATGWSGSPGYVKFDLYVPTGTAGDYAFYLTLSGSDQILFFPGGDINWLNGGSWTDTGANATLGSWHEFGLEITSYKVGATNGSMNVWYDGASVATVAVQSTSLGYVQLESAGGGTAYYVDNVEIGTGAIPEPATLSLLAVGLLLVAPRRR